MYEFSLFKIRIFVFLTYICDGFYGEIAIPPTTKVYL